MRTEKDTLGPVIKTTKPLWLAAITIVVLLGTLIYWSVSTKIAGAIVAHGNLATRETAHDVTHSSGGMVSRVAVSEGTYVQAGDELLILEDKVVNTELLMVSEHLSSLLARRVRLEAEQAGYEDLVISEATQRYLSDLPELSSRIDVQRKLFYERKDAHLREIEQQKLRKAQIEKQILAITSNTEAAEAVLQLLKNDLSRQETLIQQGFSAPAQRDVAARTFRLQLGEVEQLQARRAELVEKLSENSITTLSLKGKMREVAQVELDSIFVDISKLNAELNKLREAQQQLTVRAPISGYVHNLQNHGAGSFVRTGSTIATIIPDSQDFRAIVHAQASDIDQIYVNQASGIRFLAFNSRTLPQLTGTVEAIGAEAKIDPITNKRFYEVWIRIPYSEYQQLSTDNVLVNGMEVTSLIQTEYETPFEYITQPIRNYFILAFRDRA